VSGRHTSAADGPGHRKKEVGREEEGSDANLLPVIKCCYFSFARNLGNVVQLAAAGPQITELLHASA
jgi:hypothetical protein